MPYSRHLYNEQISEIWEGNAEVLRLQLPWEAACEVTYY